MPELPEVETIKLGLEKKIVGLKISKIQILSPKSFQDANGKPFDPSTSLRTQGIRGRKVLKVWRRAKILGLDLSSHSGAERSEAKESRSYRSDKSDLQDDKGVTLLFHLKMSGQLIYDDGKRPALPRFARRADASRGRFIGGHPTPDMVGKMPNAHTRVVFTFKGQESRVKSQGMQKSRLQTLATSHLYFNDQRKFGWVRVVNSGQVTGESSLKNLGPEPLEKGFSWQILKSNLLNHKSMPIKVAIMDQAVVSGVGNIYANEACFNAKLDPRTKVGQLTDKDMKSLHRGVLKALRDGIKHGGSSRAHFVDADGHKGYFLDYAFVYGKDKHPCKKCDAEIKKIQLRGRGTYFCPSCQI